MSKPTATPGREPDTWVILDQNGTRRTVHTSRASIEVMDDVVKRYDDVLRRLAGK